MAYAYDIDSGQEVWHGKLPSAGSAPPTSYFASGCQFIVFTATGGRFVGYGENGDHIVAFKLKTCTPK